MLKTEFDKFTKIQNLAKHIIVIASGKGGVGKSTIALKLARTLNLLNYKVGLLDADIYGPSLPKLLNKSTSPKIINNKFVPQEEFGLKTMSIGYLIPEETANIWRGPMVIKAITQLLRDVAWENLDFLVIDTPPGTGDVQLTISQKIQVTGAIIISTPQELSLADVKRGINMFKKVNIPILGLIENMSYFLCDNCNKRHYILGEKSVSRVAKELDIEILGELPISDSLSKNFKDNFQIFNQNSKDLISKLFFEIGHTVIKKSGY